MPVRMMAGGARLYVLVLLLMVLSSSSRAKKVYIVQMRGEGKPTPFSTHRAWYTASLSSVTQGDTANNDLLYVYDSAYHGYAATLEPEQAAALGNQQNVLGVYEDLPMKMHTTRTPHFLKVEDELGLWGAPGNVSMSQGTPAFHDVIVGVLDSGITPESKSFDDTGFPEIPARWKGKCDMGPDFDPFLCNKKLIGAQIFANGYKSSGANITEAISPRDYKGHGTHTASTAAGSPVPNAAFLGKVMGTAQGMAPHARVASYKVCWDEGCQTCDILAGLDQAIKDGVDIVSISLGGYFDLGYFSNAIAVASFAAMRKGIFVSASAGNAGNPGSVSNGAPWIMTVGASSIDRDFPAYVSLGNGQQLVGSSLYGEAGIDNPVGLVYSKGNNHSHLCEAGSLDPAAVQGKVVLCDIGWYSPMVKEAAVREAGGVGMILANTPERGGESLVPEAHIVPALVVGGVAGNTIRQYVLSDPNPTVRLAFAPFRLNVKPSPAVAQFSSRGPYNPSPQILKPDLIAPGVSIVAAWPGDAPLTEIRSDIRRSQFNIISGTSMACPHVSGLAALLKAAHPEWSNSAIKSALMTTAYVHDNTLKPIIDSFNNSVAGSWAIGSGHVDPRKALYPGLVYETTPDDYMAFICSLNYTDHQVQMIVKDPSLNCSRRFSDPGELNYPSFSVVMNSSRTTVQYTRELTNVGAPGSIYRVAVVAPPSVVVMVQPRRLVFGPVGDKQRYTVTFTADGTYIFGKHGSITWKNGEHRVRSPVIFM